MEIITSHTDTVNNHIVWKQICTNLGNARRCQQINLLKSSVTLRLKPDVHFKEGLQLNQALASSDTAAAKMTISVGSYNDTNQPYELDDIDVIKDWNLPDFNPSLVNSICQRNKQLRHIHIAQLPTNDIEIIVECDFARLVTPTEVVQSLANVPLG